jgi:hypothetical protein
VERHACGVAQEGLYQGLIDVVNGDGGNQLEFDSLFNYDLLNDLLHHRIICLVFVNCPEATLV